MVKFFEILAAVSMIIGLVVLVAVLEILRILKESENMSFVTDAQAALQTQSTEIDAAASRVAANTISPADASAILTGISTNTDKIKAIDPATPPPPPPPAP